MITFCLVNLSSMDSLQHLERFQISMFVLMLMLFWRLLLKIRRKKTVGKYDYHQQRLKIELIRDQEDGEGDGERNKVEDEELRKKVKTKKFKNKFILESLKQCKIV